MCEITTLHAGMNLRDAPSVFDEGETGETLGCNFSVPGQVTPMRAGLLTHSLATTIQDAKRVYIQTLKYTFTTHSDGLRVTYDVNGIDHTELIDAGFTGSFRVLPINDEYVVLTNGTLNRKWKPGWTATYQWGLNTPPVPTIVAGSQTYTFEHFEDYTDWTMTGGGITGALSDNASEFIDGTNSLKVNLDGLTAIVLTKLGALDLSGQPNSVFNLPFLQENSSSIQKVTVRFSLEADGSFDTNDNYYEYAFFPSQLGQGTPIITGVHNVNFNNSAFLVDSAGRDLVALGARVNQTLTNSSKGQSTQISAVTNEVATNDRVDGTLSGGEDWDAGDYFSIYPIIAGTWNTTNDIPVTSFSRFGTDITLTWANVTAIQIEVLANIVDTYINFDKFKIDRGTITGTYQVAVAYQNELGNYGAYSDYCDAVTINGGYFTIGNLTPDTDPQTTARRIVVLGGQLPDPWVITLDNNTATTLNYTEGVSVLEEVEVNFNNHPPPAGIDMVEWAGRIFIVGDVDAPGRVRFCEPLFYEAFPATYHRTIVEGDVLIQLSIMDQYLVMRGKGREYFMLISSDNFADWPIQKGSKEGCVSTNFLLDFGSSQVYASGTGFFQSGQAERGDYLPKVYDRVANFEAVIGAMAGKKAYLAYTDKDGLSRMLRVDYTLGVPVAGYVENAAPVAIFADEILDKVYYALGSSIYEFDAGEDFLPMKIVIPQYCGNKQVKDWSGLYYELEGDPLTLTLKADREDVGVSIILEKRLKADYPQSFPEGLEARLLEMTLQSAAGTEMIIYLPWKTIEAAYAD